MTTLYKPVLIESTEQAEALPKGSVMFDGDPEDGDTYVHVGGEWHTDGYPGLLSEALDLGFTVTALVPIEAEEEWGVEMSESGVVTHVVRAITREHAERTLSHQEPGTARLVHRIRATPWESA